MSYVFDGLVIYSAPGVQQATFDRPLGPIERGAFIEGTWTPEGGPQQVQVAAGFGVTPGGVPYYDSVAVDLGDDAELWVDAGTGEIWLEGVL